jgi:hypothetical protein
MPRIAIIGDLNPMPSTGVTPVLSVISKGKMFLNAEQVAGLIPFFPCDSPECRELCDYPCQHKNPVFGELTGKSFQKKKTYENDWNTFWVNVTLKKNSANVSVVFELEKYVNGTWQRQTLLNTNQFGIYYPLGSIPTHQTYAGYELNWGAVVFYFGEGCYRIKVRTFLTTNILVQSTTGGTQATATISMKDACQSGAITGTLQTISGNIPATYSINQPNPAFTGAQNASFIAALINAGIYPYTGSTIADLLIITGQNYAANNNVIWHLFILGTLPGGGACEVDKFGQMRLGEDPPFIITPIVRETGCLVTPVFYLRRWDCILAHGTVKFEITTTGIIGDPYRDYVKHDFCNMNVYDSVRFNGFFGKEIGKEYKTESLEWGNPKHGKIEEVRDELIQQFEMTSGLLPLYIHKRFMTFGLMKGNDLFASDYCLNNSSFELKRINVIKDSNYPIEYLDERADWRKRDKSKVKVLFVRGVQSVEKSLCCEAIPEAESFF